MKIITIIAVGWLVLMTSIVSGQKSLNYQIRQGLETGYTNRIVAFEEGYFLLETTINYPNNTKRELLLSRFDNCHNELWARRYRSTTHLEIKDALVDGDRLVILAGSGQKYPLIIFLNLDGEKIACYKLVSQGNYAYVLKYSSVISDQVLSMPGSLTVVR